MEFAFGSLVAYLAPVIALFAGLFGVFYSDKDGRKKLNTISYVLMFIIFITGVASILKVSIDEEKSQTAAAAAAKDRVESLEKQSKLEKSVYDISIELINERKNAAENRIKLTSQIDSLSGYLDAERRNAAYLRGLQLAQAFSDKHSFMKGLIVIDLFSDATDNDGVFDQKNEIFPLIGDGIVKSSLEFIVEGVFEATYNFKSSADIDVDFTASGANGSCKISRKSRSEYSLGQDFVPRNRRACKDGTGFIYNASVDGTPNTAFIINLPEKQKFFKLYSRIEQQLQDGELRPKILISAVSKGTAEKIQSELSKIKFYLKFFDSDSKKTVDDCYTAFIAPFQTKIYIEDETNVILEATGIVDQKLNYCEIRKAG